MIDTFNLLIFCMNVDINERFLNSLYFKGYGVSFIVFKVEVRVEEFFNGR